MTNKGRAARIKGHSFERFVANKLKELDPTAKRNVQETQQSSWDVLTELPLIIQCKCLKNWSTSPHAALEQAARHRHDDKIPVAIARIDRKKPDLAIVDLNDFIDLIKKAYPHLINFDKK